MTPAEYMDAAKHALGITSDNALARELSTTKQRISSYRKGHQTVSLETAYRLAIALKLDPALVVADLESQAEKCPTRAAFWRSFCSRAGILAGLLCTLASSFTAIYGTGEAGNLGQWNQGQLPIIPRYVSLWLSHAEKALQKFIGRFGTLYPASDTR
jgi:transcriptional regulator with XRE-family HTH domain